MLLAIDMGNTNIVIGCIDDQQIYFIESMSTDLSKTALEYAIGFKTVLELYKIDVNQIQGVIISSVVPPLINIIKAAIEKIIKVKPLIIGSGIKTGLNILMDDPKTVGSDLVVVSVAGVNEYGSPLIVIDCGTATTMSVIDKNKNYIGTVILPGIKVALEALVSRTAQLPRISMEAPKKVIGRNSIDCMKSGIIYGNASCIDGMIERIESELGYKTTVIATGGLSKVVFQHCHKKIIYDGTLLIKGLKIIYDKNME